MNLEELARRICHETNPLSPTHRDFIFCPERVALMMGPAGTFKTTTLCASMIVPALLYPGSRYGIFRSHWWNMEQTTLRTFKECIGRLGSGVILDEKQGPPYQMYLAPGREGPPSEVIFHSLDDIGKLGGLEFTGVAVDEVSEIEEGILTTLNARLRWKRPGMLKAEGPFFLRMACNPVRRSHWIHRKFCGEEDCDPVPWGKKFRPKRSEVEHMLPDGYYEDLSAGYSPEMRLRFIEGECGPDPSGQAVFPEFRHSLHVADIKPIPNYPGIRSWDFGRRRPAIVWAQKTPEGWVNRLAAELGNSESTRQFAKRVLATTAMRFPMIGEWRDFCDPHGTAKKSTSDESDVEVLQSLGIQPYYKDVAVKTGLEAMSQGLCTIIKGRTRSQYDRIGCQLLIEGYAGGYVVHDPRPGRALKEEPVKDGFYEHVMDCDRYLEVGLSLGSSVNLSAHSRVLRKVRPRSTTGY